MSKVEGSQRALRDLIDSLEKQRDEARQAAREYRRDLKDRMTGYEWEKGYAADEELWPWLKEGEP